jgi:hypothetical protein
MIEVLEGIGILRTIVPPATEWRVRYHFDVRTEIISKPGFPPVQGHSQGRGTIIDMGGAFLPEGTFELAAEDGEIFRVKNIGVTWAMIAG